MNRPASELLDTGVDKTGEWVTDEKRELKDILLQEGRRGRRPVDLDAQRDRLKKLAEMRKLLMLGTEADFREAMRAFGIDEASQEFSDALDAWRQFRP